MTGKVVIAKDDWGDDIVGLRKGRRYDFIKELRKKDRRMFWIVWENGQPLPFPAECFDEPRDVALIDNPLFGLF